SLLGGKGPGLCEVCEGAVIVAQLAIDIGQTVKDVGPLVEHVGGLSLGHSGCETFAQLQGLLQRHATSHRLTHPSQHNAEVGAFPNLSFAIALLAIDGESGVDRIESILVTTLVPAEQAYAPQQIALGKGIPEPPIQVESLFQHRLSMVVTPEQRAE